MYKTRNARRRLILYLKVFDSHSGELFGHIADITSTGLMILTDHPIETNKDYKLQINIPLPSSRARNVTINARCLWSKEDVNQSFNANGFKLTEIDQIVTQAIERVIDDLGFRDL